MDRIYVASSLPTGGILHFGSNQEIEANNKLFCYFLFLENKKAG